VVVEENRSDRLPEPSINLKKYLSIQFFLKKIVRLVSVTLARKACETGRLGGGCLQEDPPCDCPRSEAGARGDGDDDD
jgi:hypothetical protein